MFNSSQQGVALYLGIIIMTVILAIALGLSVISIGQLKMTQQMGDSVKALYAADSGIEKVLKMSIDDIKALSPNDGFEEANKFGDSYGYKVKITCCEEGVGECKLSTPDFPCPTNLSSSSECTDAGAFYLCYKSVGTYKEIKRAIEIER